MYIKRTSSPSWGTRLLGIYDGFGCFLAQTVGSELCGGFHVPSDQDLRIVGQQSPGHTLPVVVSTKNHSSPQTIVAISVIDT